jgi:hypothetical protein
LFLAESITKENTNAGFAQYSKISLRQLILKISHIWFWQLTVIVCLKMLHQRAEHLFINLLSDARSQKVKWWL